MTHRVYAGGLLEGKKTTRAGTSITIGIRRVGTGRIRPRDAVQVGADQDGADQDGVGQVGVFQVGFGQDGVGQVGADKVSFGQVTAG